MALEVRHGAPGEVDDASGNRVGGDSAPMLAAMGILAYAASMMTHEALGHGGYCLAAGGHTVMLTVWYERCQFPGVAGLGIKVAGPGVQFGAGLLAWLAVRLLPRDATRTRYFVWLTMMFDLLIASGYVAYSGVTNIGDAVEYIARLHPYAVWRGALVLLGSVVYSLSMLAGAFELGRFAGVGDGGRRLFRLVWIPYVTVGVFACCTGALNHTMGHGAALGFAVASSFGAGTGLLFLPNVLRGMGLKGRSASGYVGWNVGWGVAAAVVVLAFVLFLGLGVE